MSSKDVEWLLKEKYGGEKSEAFFADTKRLALGEPLAYLIGFAPFLDCKIWLDNHPLIPRSETEYWTKEAIEVIKQHKQANLGIASESTKVLDLCAGSGCIGVAVAKAVEDVSVDFCEIDADILPTISKNINENLDTTKEYEIIHSNLFSNVNNKYDFILSNPPYINPAIDRAEESVKKYEPYVALYGGSEGLEVIEKIITESPEYLAIGGQLWIEHEPEQSQRIQELAEENGFSVSTHKDQYGVERYTILVLK